MPKRSRISAKPTPWPEAIALVDEERLKEGANPSTVANWKTRGVPWDVFGPLILRQSGAQSVRETSAPYAAGPPWLNREWQATHTYTAMVSALRRLEARYPIGSKSPGAWKARIGWEAMMAGAGMLLAVAEWTEADWRRLYEDKTDLWRRPKKGTRSEAETLSERLQIELL